MDQKVGRVLQNAVVGLRTPHWHLVWMIPSVLGPPVLMVLFAWPETVALALFVSWIVLSILATLVVLDWFRTAPSGTTRDILSVPVFLFGAASILIGVGSLAFAAYNVLWEDQPTRLDVVLPIMLKLLLAMMAVTSFGWYLVRLALGHRDAKARPKKGTRRPKRRSR